MSTTASEQRTARRWPPWALVLVPLVLSAAIAVLALVTASGITLLGGGSFQAEFASGWQDLAWLLPLIPAVTALSRPLVALWQGAAIVAPQMVAAGVVIARYAASGYSDGLEPLAFATPLGLVFLTTGLIWTTATLGRSHRTTRRA